MARPSRNASISEILSSQRTFFATTKTSMGRNLLQSERNATLLIDVLRTHVAEKKYLLHDFVVMPNHVHLLLTLPAGLSIEKAMQLIKGGFSFRLAHELGYRGEVWQEGFSEERVRDQEHFDRCREYIAQNPVKAGLVDSPEKYPYCFVFLARKKAEGRVLRSPRL